MVLIRTSQINRCRKIIARAPGTVETGIRFSKSNGSMTFYVYGTTHEFELAIDPDTMQSAIDFYQKED